MNIQAGEISALIKEEIKSFKGQLESDDVGTVISVGDGIALIYGLKNAMLGELLLFPHDIFGMVMNLNVDDVGAVLLGEDVKIKEGDTVKRTGKVVEVPVGDGMLGRVVSSLGAQGGNDSSEHSVADRDFHHFAGSLDGVAFFDFDVLAKQDRADIVDVEVHDHAEDVMWEKQKLSEHGVLQTIYEGNPVADRYDGSDVVAFKLALERFDFFFDKGANLASLNVHNSPPACFRSFSRRASTLFSMEPSNTLPSMATLRPPMRPLSTRLVR